MAIKILVAGDLHLGRSSGGIHGSPDDSSTRTTWKRITDWCIGNKADMLLLTGDIVDRNNRYFEALGPLQRGFVQLGEAGIKVFMVSGNHDFDVLSQIAQGGDYENVRLLGPGGNWELASFEKFGQKIQVAGWSFPRQFVYENPLLSLSRLDIDPNYPAVGLLHCDVAVGESKYGPVDANGFAGKGLNVWALGHIHKPWIVNQDDPLVFYPGSPHAMSAKENGSHGCVLLTVESNGIIKHEQVPMSPVRFETLIVDITGLTGEGDVRNRVTRAAAEEAGNMIREHQRLTWVVYDIILEGEHRTPREAANWAGSGIEDYMMEIQRGTNVMIRKVESNVRPVIGNLEKLAEESSPAGKLAETIMAIGQGRKTPFVEALLSEWNTKFLAINDSPAYQPVRKGNENSDISKQGVRFIQKECRKLLGELLEQQSPSKQ